MSKMSNDEMVKRIQAWANDNYDNGADYIVECYSKDDIIETFLHDYEGKPYRTWKEVFEGVKRSVANRKEMQDEIESTIW